MAQLQPKLQPTTGVPTGYVPKLYPKTRYHVSGKTKDVINPGHEQEVTPGDDWSDTAFAVHTAVHINGSTPTSSPVPVTAPQVASANAMIEQMTKEVMTAQAQTAQKSAELAAAEAQLEELKKQLAVEQARPRAGRPPKVNLYEVQSDDTGSIG